ncbi:MAG: TonB family protein [Myxococcota bacterium]
MILAALALAQEVVAPATPTYPPEALRDHVAGTVVLKLDVAADGTVTGATVVRGVRDDVDAAAIEAARRLRFSKGPAVVEYAFTFALQVGDEVGNAVPGTFDVHVVDELGLDVPGVRVVLSAPGQPDRVVQTNASGHATAGFLPPGEWSVRFEKGGFAPAGASFTVAEGETRSLELELEAAGPMEELVIVGMRQRWREVTRAKVEPVLEPVTGSYQLTRRDVESTPGALEDVNRAVHKLPGVASDGDMLGTFAVRGHAPEEVVFLLDRVPLDNPYHLAGFNSIFNPDMLAAVQFYASASPASYPDTTSAVMSVTSWDGAPKDDRDDLDGAVDVSMSTVRALVMGPVGDDLTFAVAWRRSYLEAYFGAMKLANLLDTAVAAPEYDELSARAAWRPGDRHRVLVTVMRAGDHLALVDSADESTISIDGSFRLDNVLWLTSLDHRVALDAGSLQTTVAWTRDDAHVERDFAGKVETDTHRQQLYGRTDLELGAAATKWRAGASGQLRRYEIEGPVDDTRTRPTWAATPIGDYGWDRVTLTPGGWDPQAAGYAEHAWDGPLRTRAGVRVTWAGEALVSPSLGVSAPLATGTVPKVSAGIYHHVVEDPLVTDPVQGNPDLRAERALQLVAGVDQLLPVFEGGLLRLEVYRAQLDRLVVSADVPGAEVPYTNEGTGENVGADLLVAARGERVSFAGNVSWLNATRHNPRNEVFPEDTTPPWAQDWTAGLSVEYQATPRIRLTGRYDFHTGRRMSSVEPGGEDTVRLTGLNDVHLGDFHQFDLRAEWRKATKRLRWSVYLEVLNVTNFRSDFLPTATVVDGALEEGMLAHLPARPFLGVRADF